jgi:hypothetical protein
MNDSATCSRGHQLTPGNTYIRTSGHKQCKQCRAIHRRRDKHKTKAQRVEAFMAAAAATGTGTCANGHAYEWGPMYLTRDGIIYTLCQAMPKPEKQKPSREQRFWAKVDKESSAPCWIWTGAKTGKGYGMFEGRGAHVYALESKIGPMPDGLVPDHLCRNPPCVNPDHLEPVTPRENTLRGIGPTAINAKKTHCNRGHELAGDNLGNRADGHRHCKECAREAAREQWAQGKHPQQQQPA